LERDAMRTVIFGAGTDCLRLLERGLPGEEVIGLIDNDPAKPGTRLHGIPILSADALGTLSYDRVRLASSETPTIRRQALALGVPEEKLWCPLLEPANRSRLAALSGRHAGQRAVIVGNGPSLRLGDLDTLSRQREVVKFACNKIYLAYERTAFRPDYFMVEDFLVAENNAAALNAHRGCPKLYRDTLLRWLEPDDDTILFGMTVLEPKNGVIQFSEDPLEFFWGASVTYTALQLAFHLGCTDVYLTGIDFTFATPVSDPTAPVFRAGGEKNHFLPDYRQPGERWNRPRPDVTRLAYEAARAHAARTGRRIFNATRGGALEVFERVPFDQAFPAG
jgi:hypothetical protein